MNSQSTQAYAIDVQNVWKSFGRRKSSVEVLKGITLHIPKGIIYGLIGPSGCGKTTLLKCLFGRIHVDKGNVLVFGEAPGSGKNRIPGEGVGYMPQELALYENFTISEMLMFSGRANNVKEHDIKSRAKVILNMLQLQEVNKLIGELSSGQMRRVSFAVALLHDPPLLILDEPTVGADPILRESMWNNLHDLSQTRNVTIIITTHYIEEARLANTVGFMRNGVVLAEDNPVRLLNQHNLSRLEDVFLKLCKQSEVTVETQQNGDAKDALLQVMSSIPNSNIVSNNQGRRFTFGDLTSFSMPSCARILSLLHKNFTLLRRALIVQLFIFANPAMIMFFFCLTFGKDPRNLPVAISNQDYQWGSNFLQLRNSDTIHYVPVADFQEGVNLVSHGQAIAAVDIWPNFTSGLQERFRLAGKITPEDVLQAGSIHVTVDGTDPISITRLQKEISDIMKLFAGDSLSNYTSDATITALIQNGPPIYGKSESVVTEYMAPGIMICIIFAIASGLISIILIRERQYGLLDRCYVIGFSTVEIITGNVLSAMFNVVIQVVLTVLIITEGFNVPCEGNILLVYLLTLLQGLCGVSYGSVISSIADTETSAVMLTLGTILPFTLLSGIIWPLQAASKLVQFGSSFLPQTFAIESLKWIMIRGKGLSSQPVWFGFMTTIAWILIFLIMSAVIMRIRR